MVLFDWWWLVISCRESLVKWGNITKILDLIITCEDLIFSLNFPILLFNYKCVCIIPRLVLFQCTAMFLNTFLEEILTSCEFCNAYRFKGSICCRNFQSLIFWTTVKYFFTKYFFWPRPSLFAEFSPFFRELTNRGNS